MFTGPMTTGPTFDQKLGVIVRPMGGYQLPEWVRITVGTPKENKRCVDTLSKVLA